MATPTSFPEANFTWTAPPNMPECQSLAVQDDGDQSLSCWKLSWRERIAALFFGRVWLGVVGWHPPVWIRAVRDPHEERA